MIDSRMGLGLCPAVNRILTEMIRNNYVRERVRSLNHINTEPQVDMQPGSSAAEVIDYGSAHN